MDGRALEPESRSPSSEALMHTAVLRAKPEAQAVIHCHAPHATILVNAGLPFLPVSTEAAFFQKIGRIPFVMPGTQELADAVVEALGDGWAVLLQNHGLLVAGRSAASRSRPGGDHRALLGGDPGLLRGGQGAAGAARGDRRDALQPRRCDGLIPPRASRGPSGRPIASTHAYRLRGR